MIIFAVTGRSELSIQNRSKATVSLPDHFTVVWTVASLLF